MTRREWISRSLGAGLLSAGSFVLSGCGGDGQPARVDLGPAERRGHEYDP